MIYFVTRNTGINAIELSQIKRLSLFKDMNQPAKIVETKYSSKHDPNVINIFDYFLKSRSSIPHDLKDILKTTFGNNGFSQRQITNDITYYSNSGVTVKTRENQVEQIDFLSRGFLSKIDVYQNNRLSHSILYDNQGSPKKTVYYDVNGTPTIELSNKYILLNYQGVKYKFQSYYEFAAFFLSNLMKPKDIMVIDRASLAMVSFLRQGMNTYFYIHSMFSDKSNHESIEILKKLIADARLKGLICSTQKQKEDLVKYVGLSQSQVYCIPATYKDNVATVSWNQRDKNRIICVARISREKRIEETILAFSKINKALPQTYLEIYGYVNNQKYKQELETLIGALALKGKVKFKDFVENLNPIYDNAVLQLVTSKSEGLSMTLIEGQSHGLPAISYNVDYGPRTILPRGLLTKEDHEKMAQLAIRLLKDPARMQRISSKAQRSKAYRREEVEQSWKALIEGK